jgi:FAD/FMN-containing dehydrogenase
MHPFLLAYPLDELDITCIIDTARILLKKIVVRSGGHQYCGLSSGGEDTVVVCMDNFNTVSLNADGLVEIGPCVPLKKAVKQFRDWGISLPHG